MGFHFSKPTKLLPGVRVNSSKSGVFLSIDPRGASVTIGKVSAYGNVGIPGTGISYRERPDRPDRPACSYAPLRPQLPLRLTATKFGSLTNTWQPIDLSLYPQARRVMKAEVAQLVARNADACNSFVGKLTAQHHDILLGTRPAGPNLAKLKHDSYPS